MEDGKSKIIVGAVIAIVAVGVVALIAFNVYKGAQPVCELTAEKPQSVSPTELPKLPSNDFMALARFNGYLEYELPQKSDSKDTPTVDKKYMALSFDSVGFGNRSLTLNANCSTINLKLTNTTLINYIVETIEVGLTVPNGDVSSCKVEKPAIEIDDGTKKHYSCSKPLTYLCLDTGKNVTAHLIINTLEFEVGGNLTKTKEGEFTTVPQMCE